MEWIKETASHSTEASSGTTGKQERIKEKRNKKKRNTKLLISQDFVLIMLKHGMPRRIKDHMPRKLNAFI